jgi:hypothetical protein
MKGVTKMLTKRTRGNQVTLPKDLIKKAQLSEEDIYFDITYKNGAFSMKPVSLKIEEKISDEAFASFAQLAFKKEKGDRDFSNVSEAEKFLRKRIEETE